MDHRAETWYRRRTSHWQDWPLAALLDAKQRSGARISVVMPARNEEQTVAGVVLEAGHTCMTQRGIRALGATTVTSALLGTLRTDARSRAEFFALARVPTSPEPA
jgi:GTP cyclohydrolase I